MYGVASVKSSFSPWINVSAYWEYHLALLQTTGTDDNFSLGEAFDREIWRYGRAFENHFDTRGRDLNNPIFKSSPELRPWGGGGRGSVVEDVMFRFDLIGALKPGNNLLCEFIRL